MLEQRFPYSEEILQQIWQQMHFSRQSLQTTCGKSIQILHPGNLNSSDGPDFLNAKLNIDRMIWHGAVELHLKAAGWRQHGHFADPNYNNVILHVVTEYEPEQVVCQDKSRPFTLNLLPYLDSKMAEFVNSYSKGEVLPCAAHIHFISEEAFKAQIEKAHSEYLEQKVNDFFSFFEAEKLQSEAWKHALFISLFDGFGISNNRIPMQVLARRILSESMPAEQSDFIQKALNLAFDPGENLIWKYKAHRPAGHPEKRVAQAAALGRLVLHTPFSEFLKTDALQLWSRWCGVTGYQNTGRIKILYGTVFIPALYAAASMFAHFKLQSEAHHAWLELQSPIPESLIKPFRSMPVSSGIFNKKAGSVYQLRAYCKPKRCSECFVFKKAFES